MEGSAFYYVGVNMNMHELCDKILADLQQMGHPVVDNSDLWSDKECMICISLYMMEYL